MPEPDPTLVGPWPYPVEREEGGETAVGDAASEAQSSVVGEAAGETRETERATNWRADGRPTWWIGGVQRDEGGVVRIAAEALADGVLDARRAALEAGRAALAQEGADPDLAVAERLAVRRLRGDAPGRERYVGYVLMSVPAARSDGGG